MGRFLIAFIPKLTFQPFTHSTIQLSSPFTPHSSLSRPPPHPNPQPYGIQSHSAHSSPVRTSIPQGARENILLNKPFNFSTVQPFNSLHASLFTLLQPYRLPQFFSSLTLPAALQHQPSLSFLSRETIRQVLILSQNLNFRMPERLF